MTFKIESGIPAPITAEHSRKYPFNEMKVGDSFLINGGAVQSTVSNAAHAYGKMNGQKFSIRKTPDGPRCWRIK